MPASQNTYSFQNTLRTLEIEAHTANVPMDEVINLIERQFLLAAMQRHPRNMRRVAVDIGRDITTVYRKREKLREHGLTA